MIRLTITEALQIAQLKRRYELEQYTDKELVGLFTALNKVEKEILHRWDALQIAQLSKERARELMEFTRPLLAGIKTLASERMITVASETMAGAATAYSEILSFNGKATHVNSIRITPDRLTAFWKDTPVGGQLLQDWVTNTFDGPLIDRIQQEVAAGLLQAETYPQLVKRFKEGFGMSRNQIDTLVRTYVQSANAAGMQRVYDANQDIIKALQWSAAPQTRTCLVCASLDKQEFPLNDHPPCPCHCRCRCQMVPVTSLKALGLPDKDFDAYLKRTGSTTEQRAAIRPVKKFLLGQSEPVQRKYFGPGRFELLQAGVIRFEDLVDTKALHIRTLEELLPGQDVKAVIQAAKATNQAAGRSTARPSTDDLESRLTFEGYSLMENLKAGFLRRSNDRRKAMKKINDLETQLGRKKSKIGDFMKAIGK